MTNNDIRRDIAWLGKATSIETIGPYTIVQYIPNSPIQGETYNYTAYIDGIRDNWSYLSLDEALAGAIAFAHEGSGHMADKYFIKSLGIK